MDNERLVTPELMDDEVAHNRAYRPDALDSFCGQEQVKDNIHVAIHAANRRDEALDHVLLSGPAGLGKTTLAKIIARELNANIRITTGPVISKPGDLAALLTNLQPRDVLFIDEIHRLHTAVGEILYSAMEDYKLDLLIGEGPSARSVQIDLPPFTLVGATTRLGLVTRPLRERFGLPLSFSFYEPEALRHIVINVAKKMVLPLDPEGAMEVAKRSRGTPRIAIRLLRRIRDYYTLDSQQVLDRRFVGKTLDGLHIDDNGFDQMDRRYLNAIAHKFSGGPVGVETLAALLSEEKDVLEDVIEPFLIQKGLIHRTSRGRILAREGWSYLGIEAPDG